MVSMLHIVDRKCEMNIVWKVCGNIRKERSLAMKENEDLYHVFWHYICEIYTVFPLEEIVHDVIVLIYSSKLW